MSLLSTLGAGITGFLTGGPAGAAMGVASAVFNSPGTSGRPPMPALPTWGSGGAISIGGPSGVNVSGGFNFGQPGGGGAGPSSSAGGCPRGYHLNKSALPASRRHGAVRARSICVRNRSMNPLNPKALRRALGREKRARKLISRLHVYKPVAARRGSPIGRRKR